MEDKNIYKFLVDNKLTTKSEEEFYNQYSDRNEADKLFDFFKKNNLTQKDSDSFYNEYFSKKKDTPQPYQPTSEEPTEVSKTDSEGIDLGVYPTAFTPKEDIEKVSEAGGLQGEKLKRKASEIALESTSTLREQQKELENQIKGYQDVFNNSKTRLEDIQLEFSELNDNLSNKYGLYYNQETGAYDIPKSMQPQFNQDVSVLNQLQKDFEAVQQGIKDNANAYRNSANRYAINKEALAQRGTPIGTFMTNLISEGVPTIVGGLGAFATDYLFGMSYAGMAGAGERKGMVEADEKTKKSILEDVQAVQDEMSNFLYDKIGVHAGSTKEYIEQQTEEGDFWNIIAGGVGTSIPAMLTAGLTGGTTFYAQAYDFADEAVKDIEGLSEGEKVAYKTTVAAITGALEKYGFSSLLKNKSIANSVVGRVLKRLPSIAKGKSANVSDDFINIVLDEGRIANATMNRFGQKAIDVGTRMATGFLAEAETGGLQSLAENSIEQSINLLKGEEVFDSKDWYDFTKEFLFDAAAEGVGGAAISGTIGLFSRKGATQKQFDAAAKYLGDIRLEAIGAALEADVEAGNMTKEQAKATYDKIKQYKEDLARLPEDFPDSKKGEAVSLIQKRNGLQEKLGKVDESFKPKVQQEIDNINAKLAEMGSVSDADIAAREAEVAAKEAEEELSFFEDIVEGGASEARRVYDEEKSRVEANAEAEVERIVSEQEAMAETEAREAQRKANIAEATVTGETMAVEREAAKPSKREGDKAKPKDLTKTEGEQDFTEAERPTPVTSAPATRTPEQEKMGAMVSRAKEAQRKARQERANKKAVEEAVKTPPTAEVSEDIGPEVDFVTDDELADAMVQGAETPSVNDKILNILDKAIDATSTKGRAFDATLGLPMFMANSALKIVRAAYKGGMSLADAVKKGYNFVRSQGYELDLDAFDTYVKQSLTGKKETDAVQEQTAGEVPVQPEAEVSGEMEEGVPDTEPQEATQEGKKPRVAKDKKGITSLMERVFGLNKSKSKAAARIYDLAIGTIAERAGITKEEAYRMIGLVKGKKEQLKGKGNVLFQSLSSFVWESTAKRGIEAIKQNAATPEQWVKMITDKGGKGTSQELEWIGLSDFLNDYVKENGVKSVPRDVVEQYINDNQIEIVEVTKGGQIDLERQRVSILNERNNYLSELENKYKGQIFASDIIADVDFGVKPEIITNEEYEKVKDYQSKLEEAHSKIEKVPLVRHSQLTLEGGENYREVLLTLPNNRKSDQKFYKKSHFDEGNILAHLRINERTLPNGERVMFIEEVQSDWAQEGKKKGFDDKKQDLTPRYRRLDNGIDFWEIGDETQKGEVYFDPDRTDATVYTARAGNRMQDFDNKNDAIKWAQDNIPKQRGVISDMPYKKTDQWVGMAMRRVFKMAADEGFNRVAWVTGEQSADRYDLSKQVDYIDYWKNDNGTYGFATSVELTKPSELTAKELESYVGKEIAERIINDTSNPTESNPSRLEGQDLKVGGEGMKTFYNSILPKVAKKEAQRFDKKANVEVVDFSKSVVYDAVLEELSPRDQIQEVNDGGVTRLKSSLHNPNKNFVISNGKDGYIGVYNNEAKTYTTREKAIYGVMSLMEKDIKPLKRYVTTVNGIVNKDRLGGSTKEEAIRYYKSEKGLDKKEGASKQLSIAITPEMRMNLNSAIPLFQGEQGAMVVAEDGNYIIYALTDPNVSTPLHELAHVYEHYLTEQERADIEAWSGHKSGTVEFSEAFARGFEKYLADGKAPNDKLKKVFENFKKWLTEIYDGITGSEIDLELNDKMRSIYDAMLGGETTPENIRVAQTKVQLPSIKAAMPFLDGFDITKLTEDQINLLNEVMETYLETGELVGDGTLRAIVEGIQGAESNGPNAKMTADSLDIRAGEYLNLIAAIMGRSKNAWIRLQRELGLTGENGLTIGLTKASAFRNNFYEIIERVTGNKVYEKGTESRVQVVGIVLQRIGQMVGDRNTVEQVINDVLDDFQRTAEYLKVYGDPSLGDYASNIEKAVAKVRGATTADEVMAKLSPKEKEVLEVYYEANNVGIDEKIEVSRANGRPLKVIPNYLHIPIRSKTVVEPQNNTPTNNTLSNPAQINISNAFAPQTVSTRSTGAQQSRVANAHKLPEGSYYDPMFFSAQAKSFNNTNVAIFTYQAIQKMNAFLSTGEAVERFGGGKRGRSNIEAFQKSVNQALNAESLSAKASVELREFKVSGVKVGETLNTLQRIAKKRGIVWVMARPAQFFLQAPVFINTIGHVLMSPLMLKNPIAAMAVLQRAIVFQTQTWTKEKGWQNRRGLPWADLIKLAPAGIRDIRESFAFMEGDSEDVISRRSGITNKAIRVYDKADDAALKYSVAVTDRASAQMSWLALYESYMLENGLVGGDVDLTNRESYNEWWKSQGQNPNYDAIAYADTMVAKDQNASANFQRAILQTDKSAFEKLFRSLVFPLINFKINKIQSIRSESKIISTINKKVTAEDRLSAGGRLLFTAAEMYVYHQVSIFLVGAWKELVDSMWKSATAYITGDDDDEIFDEDDMGKTIKNQKRFWTRWITESAPLLSTLNIDQRMQNGMAEAYNFMCYQFNKQTDTAFASQYPEYESYARSGEAPAKVEFIDDGIGNAGYLGIVAEQVMTIDEMWEAAMNGERENQYGEMIYYTPEQQQKLKLTATLATINAVMPSHPLTAEVFGMVNRSFYKENNKAYENMLARDLETIGKGIPEEDAIAIMNSYIQTTYKDLFEQEGITALTAIGESLKRDVGNVVKREVLKESFKSIYNSEDAKINEFLVRASRGGSPRDKANKIFARIKALDKMGETEKRDKLAYEAYVLSLKGITVGQDQGLSIVLLLDAYNYNKNVLGGKSFLELSTEMSKKYAKNKERPYSTKGFTP